jgi:hypothetical protein
MTRKLMMAMLAMAAIAAAPAQAGQGNGKAGGNEQHGGAGSCAGHAIGFNASGTLLSRALTPAADGRFSGTLTVDVKRANHRAPTGSQTYVLAAARVHSDGTPAPGDRVKLHGKLTRSCGSAASTTVDVRWVTVKAPR